MRRLIEWIRWYVRSDIELEYTTCWHNENELVEKIDGFCFYSKKPFSRSYQWCSTLPLEATYPVLSMIQEALKERRKAALLEIRSGLGVERMFIWKGSLKKAERQLNEMIKQIQKQY
jgi:hypothetical protein